MVVVMRKEECVTGDVEHGIITPHRFRALSRSSHMRHILCVCVDLRVVCHTSPFGECAALRISSTLADLDQCLALFLALIVRNSGPTMSYPALQLGT